MMDARSDAMPLAQAARERLRDRQQEETRRLAAVLAAHDRLNSERSKAAALIAKAEAGVAARQAVLDNAVLDLVDTSGLARTATLLDRASSDLARLRRAGRRKTSKAKDVPEGRGPDVPA